MGTWYKHGRQRDVMMAEQYRTGITLVEIGQIYGITRQRVWAILSRRMGLSRLDGGAHVRKVNRKMVSTAGRR